MSVTGIIIAAVIVGGTGLFIGVFLGVAGKKFAVEVERKPSLECFREITAAAAVTQAVPVLRRPSSKEKPRSGAVR